MELLLMLFVGGIVGWLASVVMRTNAQMGVIANVVVGIVGAFIGFWLAGLLGIAAYGAIGSWGVSLLGAIVLLAILRALGVYR